MFDHFLQDIYQSVNIYLAQPQILLLKLSVIPYKLNFTLDSYNTCHNFLFVP